MQDVCPSTRKNDHIYLRCLHEACVLLGGEHHLARYLNVTVEQVDDWLNARSYPPDDVFLRCSDLLHQRARPAS